MEWNGQGRASTILALWPSAFEPLAARMFTDQPSHHSAVDLRIGLVVSRYHDEITGALAEAAKSTFLEAGGREDDLTVLRAPGAFEIPVMVDAMAYAGMFDAIVALGCVMTGETPHDRYIADSVAHALQSIAVESGIPVAFGILTCQSIEQARERAGGARGNKGAEAMRAVIDALGEMRRLHGIDQPVADDDEGIV